MLSRIKAVFILIEFVITVLIIIVLMYIFRDKTYAIRQRWAKMQSFLMGFNVIQKGEIDKDAQLLLLNHQSLVDIVVLEMIYGKDLCWIAKEEIAKIPLFGHIINAPKMIAIDRKDKRSIIKIIKESKDRLSKGRVIAMFPEGTRGDGAKLLKFQSGGKILAEKLNLKVQPVILTNTRTILDSQKFRAKSGNVSVTFLDTITPSDDEQWYEKMKDKMEECLKHELANNSSHR
ncbi:MAG TPA: 1-acyl-sn-glycerol-3-phosphate acyltransferase [Sulfurospirillum sp. UBA12182]|jgi:1-acyl-sn-glycerol-3-phosphate acyltransferase|nr:MAG TPA: 1-acyl-sn-glycerol-3-phosphate acyltransferase [Sulfurospirillum sp. UBA12182]